MRLTALAAVMLSGPALAAAQPYTFVSTPASDALVMIDLSTDTAVASVPVSGLPTGCAVGRLGRRVCAALTESNALAIIDTLTGDVRMVPVGARPAGVALAARKAYVANTGDDTVSVVKVGTGAVLATIPVGDGPFAVVAGGRRVYVANRDGATVSAIDAATNAVMATVPVGNFPAGLALNTRTRRLYVANFLDDTVSVIDTATLSVLSTIPVVRSPRGLAVDAAGQRLFVAGFDDARVQIIDTATGSVTLEAASGGLNPVDLMLGPQGTRLYVAHLQETQGVAALDAATLAPVATVDLPAGPLAFSGLARRGTRAPLASGWRTAARALSASLRGFAAILASDGTGESRSFQAGTVISDEEFDLAHWDVSGMAEHTTSQQLSGGNPGAWRRTTHFPTGFQSETVHRLVRPGSQYDPSTQGALSSIDASWDRINFSGNDVTIFTGFVVEQDGVVYRTPVSFSLSAGWEAENRTNLGAGAFNDGSGGHPDFSAAGSPLRFGYFLQTLSAIVTHGVDNFALVLHPDTGGVSTLGFAQTFDALREEDTRFVWVQRRSGVQGAVTVDVLTERPDGTTLQDTLSWPDGDAGDKAILTPFLDLPDGSGARTARFTLVNPTGGAAIDPLRGTMAITVVPREWGPQIEALFIRLWALLGSFSSTWLIVLSLPAAALAVRGARARRA